MVKKDKIVDQNNNTIWLKGIQFDFGSIRGDIPEHLNSSQKLNTFCDAMIESAVTEYDFAQIKEMGANSIRLSLNTYKDFVHEGQNIDFRENNFKRLDALIRWAEKYGIYIIISMRQSPGGHNPSPHSGNNGYNRLWTTPDNQEQLNVIWKKIAQRYADREIIIGYDLLNEPVAPDKSSLNRVYSNIINSIRSVDRNHIIFLEGNNWGKNIDQINLPKDSNIVFSIHFYIPDFYANKGAGTYPSIMQGREFNKVILGNELDKLLVYAQKANKPIWIGEFGAVTKSDNHLGYDRDLIELFNERELSWTYWHYKNIKGFTDTQAIYYVGKNNKFKFFIDSVKADKSMLTEMTLDEINDIAQYVETKYFLSKPALKQLLSTVFSENQ